MDINWKTEGNVTILALGGEIDTGNLDELKQSVEPKMEEGALRLAVNLQELKFINSSGIGYFVALHKRLVQEGGEMVLSSPSKFLQTTIKTLGLDRVFQVYGSDADAVDHFGGGAAETITPDAPIDPSLLGSTEMKFRFADEEGPEAHARILHIWKDGISFRYPDDPDRQKIDPDEISFGRKIIARFQQPFIDKDHTFEIEGEIAYALDQDDGSVKFHLRYTRIEDGDLKMIEAFVHTKDLVLPFLPPQE